VSDALLIALVLVAALACPLAMWWQARRGRPACIVAPRNRSEGVDDDIEGVRARHDELGARIARMRACNGRSQKAVGRHRRAERISSPS